MRSFCTNIQEIAKMRGLVEGEPCRSVGYKERGREIFRVIEPKEVITNTTVISINLRDIIEKGIEGDINININL